ncbi:MAG: carbohydrate ABC transporter permease [Clostridia bacterium]|nr:carbohydrate ABC transporter permease [Clostridia bacterium]
MAIKKKFSLGSFSLRLLLRIFLIAWGITVVYPLFWMVISSFKSSVEFYLDPWTLPQSLMWENYESAWVSSKFSEYFLNSALVVTGSTALYLLMLTTTAYAIGKYKFRLQKPIEIFYFFAMMIPTILLTIPLYFMMFNLGLTDNRAALGAIYALQSLPGGLYLLIGFVKNINNAFIEAAEIDGAGEWYIFTRVILPFVKPTVLYLAVVKIMSTWNEYVLALTYLRTESKFTVPIGVSYLTNTMEYRVDFGAMFAALTISVLPIFILFAVFQKHILSGVDAGEGVKG